MRDRGELKTWSGGRQGVVEKENKTFGTERCENIKNLYKKDWYYPIISKQYLKTIIVFTQI